MMAAFYARAWVSRAFRGRKDILPLPGFRRTRVFVVKGVRQIHLAISFQYVSLVQEPDFSEMSLERLLQRLRQHRNAILRPFALADGNLIIGEIEVFHAES